VQRVFYGGQCGPHRGQIILPKKRLASTPAWLRKVSLLRTPLAVYTQDLLKPKSGDRWLLITSAYHMPRAVGVFRRAGFDVVPFPVDFRTRDDRNVCRPFERIGEEWNLPI
jgi:hypothetical protein